MRICEECGTERRITLLEQAVTTLDGQVVIGLFGEGRCLCPSYALDALDLEALDDTRKQAADAEDASELDLESAEPDLDLGGFEPAKKDDSATPSTARKSRQKQ